MNDLHEPKQPLSVQFSRTQRTNSSSILSDICLGKKKSPQSAVPTGEPWARFHAAQVAPDLLLHRAPIPGRELPGCRALSGMVQQPLGFRKVSRSTVGPEQKQPFQHGRQQAGAQPSSLHPLTSHIRGLGLHRGFCNDPQEKERRCECYRSCYSFIDDFFFFLFSFLQFLDQFLFSFDVVLHVLPRTPEQTGLPPS